MQNDEHLSFVIVERKQKAMASSMRFPPCYKGVDVKHPEPHFDSEFTTGRSGTAFLLRSSVSYILNLSETLTITLNPDSYPYNDPMPKKVRWLTHLDCAFAFMI